MIELTRTQVEAVMHPSDEPLKLVDPSTGIAYVLLREEEYERLKERLYDDSPWSEEEMDLLAAEDADALGWEGMDPYQDSEP